MALKYKTKSKEEIPAGMETHYIERDGAWFLDVEGVVDKTKLEELRTNNLGLTKQLEEVTARFEGIDPDAVKAMSAEKAKLEQEKLLKAGEVDKVIDARIKAAKGEWDKVQVAVVAERDALNARLTLIQIDQAVVSEATKRGLRRSATPDITARARMSLHLVNGVPQVIGEDGQNARLGKDGLSPMGIAEWLDMQVSEAPHLFETNAGGGAVGSGFGGAGNGSVKNPFRKETWNLTEQMRMQRNDPGLAARLKASA